MPRVEARGLSENVNVFTTNLLRPTLKSDMRDAHGLVKLYTRVFINESDYIYSVTTRIVESQAALVNYLIQFIVRNKL